jgi:predicted ATPase
MTGEQRRRVELQVILLNADLQTEIEDYPGNEGPTGCPRGSPRASPSLAARQASGSPLPAGMTGTPPATARRVGDPAQLAAVTRYEGVRLFLDLACGHEPRFSPTPEQLTAIAEVCHQLDGIPLALELAAARVKALSVEQIAARLDDWLRLLTGGSRTALPRQQTLRATLDWSYELLSEGERALLRRVSVFAGGFTLAAAEAVCAGEEVPGDDLLNLLIQLVDKSLVLAEEREGDTRYRLLETIRQYGQERLAAKRSSAVIDYRLVAGSSSARFSTAKRSSAASQAFIGANGRYIGDRGNAPSMKPPGERCGMGYASD